MAHALKAAEGIATIVIAIYVASIGTFQWFTARDKLRLDLYNRRFDVYLRAWAFMDALMGWCSVPEKEQLSKKIAFIQAFRESQFLFADDPRIFRLLEEVLQTFVPGYRIRRGIEQILGHHAPRDDSRPH